MRMYVVYDSLAEEAGPIFTAPNDKVAHRQFKNVLDKVLVKEEYKLFFLGEFDPHGMGIAAVEPTEILSNEEKDI